MCYAITKKDVIAIQFNPKIKEMFSLPTDLKALSTEIMKLKSKRNLRIKGDEVRTIPVNMCHYNDSNPRISSYMSHYITDGNLIDKSDTEAYKRSTLKKNIMRYRDISGVIKQLLYLNSYSII